MTSPIFKNFTEDPKLEEFCPGGKPKDDWYVSQTCPESQLIHHNPPLVFDLNRDPFEMYHLSPKSKIAQEMVDKAYELREIHKSSVAHVQSILGFYDANVIPCCGPNCECDKMNSNMEVVQRRAFTKWPSYLPRNKTTTYSKTQQQYEFVFPKDDPYSELKSSEFTLNDGR